jgi:hypothetical protein
MHGVERQQMGGCFDCACAVIDMNDFNGWTAPKGSQHQAPDPSEPMDSDFHPKMARLHAN